MALNNMDIKKQDVASPEETTVANLKSPSQQPNSSRPLLIMRSILCILALYAVYLTTFTTAQTTPSSVGIRLLIHNIRYAANPQGTNERPWATRRPLVVNQLRLATQYPSESLICLQEVLNNQLLDILTDLNSGNTTSEWTYVGVGRDDGATRGEYSPIFYRPAIWSLNSFKSVWLSPTPDVPSKGWDAGSIRILSIATMTHRATGRQLVSMCTHLDNAGTVSRLNSAKIIIDRIDEATGIKAGKKPYLPVLLGGDFNSQPNQEAYLEMSRGYSAVEDLMLKVPAAKRYGNTNTYTAFTDAVNDDTLIDFLWFGPKNSSYWKVQNYGVLPNKFDDGVYNSDHRAVVGDVVLV